FADAVAWHPNTTDPTLRSLVETALSASGLLGASLRRDGAHTTAWSVDANGNVVHPNLATVLVADPTHPDAALADRVLHRVPLLDNSEAAGSPAGLVIGRDGTFSVGPLHGRPPGTDDAGQLRPAEYVGAAQRRAAALKRAAELEEQAASLELDATRHDQTAGQLAGNASKISSATQNFPPRSAAHTAEATRAVAAGRAANAAQDATDAEQAAAEQAEIAQERRLEWEQRTRARGLPIDVSQLTSLRDNGERNAKELTTLAKQLAERFTARLDRLAADIRDDNVRTDKLAQHHADTTTAVRNAQRITNEHQALVEAVGLNANVAVNRHAQAVTARNALAGELTRASRQADEARQTVERRGYDLEQAQRQVNDARPPVTAAQRQLRTLLNVGGVAEVLFDPDAIPDLDNIDALVAAVGRAVQGRRTTSRRTLRERYDDSRAELAGLWTLDPGDTIENLDTYHLTHDTVGYTPPAAADAGRQLRERAQAALDRAEESALREFVIGRLPLAIGTAWVTMEDWVKAVNRKMQNATASSGVRVRINKALPKT
ncbi:MAG TPA: hypothetical protein VF657_09830, partial [Actinoplanes sp.]